MGHHNRDMRIRVSNFFFAKSLLHHSKSLESFVLFSQVNGGEWEIYPQVTALCVGNAKYFGGGMKITPNAIPGNGNLEVQQFVSSISNTM